MPLSDDGEMLVLLTDLARLIRTFGDRRARVHGMTRAQWIILFRLRRHPGLTQRELAEILEVEPISVGRLIDRLAARGVVERRADPTDRRVWRLHLTQAAEPVLAEIDIARAALGVEAMRGLGREERDGVAAALRKMKANLLALDGAGGAPTAAAS